MRHLLKLFARPVACVVIAAQLLLVVPATAQVPGPGNLEHCDEMASLASAASHDGCPCCPDDPGSMQGCLAMCSLAAAIAPGEFIVAVTPSHVALPVEISSYQTSLAEPPLKPPPID